MPGSVLRSELFVISVDLGGGRRHKIFQCRFAKRDGSILVNFPYFRQTDGLVSLVQWPAGQASTTANLELGGKVTSHLVKYSHHPDGRAHFSQDGRVLTQIKKDSVPLAELEGHFFTLHVHGLQHFEPLPEHEANKAPTPKRAGVRFVFDGEEPQSVKFVGMLYRDTTLERRSADGVIHPSMQFMGPDGKARTGMICSTALGLKGQERCLLVYCEPLPRMDQTRSSSMLFVAGFESATVMNDVAKPVSYLAFSYPVEEPEQLRQRIGSIDREPPNLGLQPTADGESI